MKMIDYINDFTSHLTEAMEIGESSKFNNTDRSFSNILICGLGGSGIGGTILNDIVSGETNQDQYSIPVNDDSICLSVQVFSASKKLKKNDLKDLDIPFYLTENNLYKYFSGCFTDLKAVKKHQKELVDKGYSDCFIVGMHNKKKINIDEVLELLK